MVKNMRLTVEKIYKSFGSVEVLRGVDLEVSGAGALGLLGRNGAGKTTAIRIIMKVFPPDSGRVLLDGKPLERDRVRIGYLPEERGLYAKKEVLGQLVYLATLKGMTKSDAKKDIMSLLERLGMQEVANRRLNTLSKGNQQKIQLVSALTGDPDIVILDEPFSGLDPVNAMLLKDIVRELVSRDKIVLFSSHQMNYVEEFCENIAILNKGEIVLSGNIRDIKRSYERNRIEIRTPFVGRLSESLRQLEGVKEITSLPDGGALEITLSDSSEKAALLDAVSRSGIEIDSFVVTEPELNDIFVSYTEAAV